MFYSSYLSTGAYICFHPFWYRSLFSHLMHSGFPLLLRNLPHIQFSPIPCPIFPNNQMITVWCFPSLFSTVLLFPSPAPIFPWFHFIPRSCSVTYVTWMFTEAVRFVCRCRRATLAKVFLQINKSKTLRVFTLSCPKAEWEMLFFLFFQFVFFDRQLIVFYGCSLRIKLPHIESYKSPVGRVFLLVM